MSSVMTYSRGWPERFWKRQPGCRCSPLRGSKRLCEDLAQTLQCLVSLQQSRWSCEMWLWTTRPRKSQQCSCSSQNDRHTISCSLISCRPRGRPDTWHCSLCAGFCQSTPPWIKEKKVSKTSWLAQRKTGRSQRPQSQFEQVKLNSEKCQFFPLTPNMRYIFKVH